MNTEIQQQAFETVVPASIEDWNQSLLLELLPRNIYDEPQSILDEGKLISLNVKNMSRDQIILSPNLGLMLLRYSNAEQKWYSVNNNVQRIESSSATLILAPKGGVDNEHTSEKYLPVTPIIEGITDDVVTVRVVITGKLRMNESEERLIGAYIDLIIHVN